MTSLFGTCRSERARGWTGALKSQHGKEQVRGIWRLQAFIYNKDTFHSRVRSRNEVPIPPTQSDHRHWWYKSSWSRWSLNRLQLKTQFVKNVSPTVNYQTNVSLDSNSKEFFFSHSSTWSWLTGLFLTQLLLCQYGWLLKWLPHPLDMCPFAVWCNTTAHIPTSLIIPILTFHKTDVSRGPLRFRWGKAPPVYNTAARKSCNSNYHCEFLMQKPNTWKTQKYLTNYK